MKKIIVLVLTLFVLTSCTTVKPTNPYGDNTNAYFEKMKAFEVKEITGGQKDNEEFSALLNEIALESLGKDYLSLHFTMVEPEAFGIEKPEVIIGEIGEEVSEEAYLGFEEELNAILAFDYDSLSANQQYLYQILEYSYYETLAGYEFEKYSIPFAPYSGVHENIITNFTEFKFYDQESIDDYLVLLADVDRYFEDALKLTKARAQQGYFILDSGVDLVVEFNDDFVSNTTSNALILTFETKIDEFEGLTNEQRADYKAKNKQIFLEEIVPAYNNLSKEMVALKGSSKLTEENPNLSRYSKDYAEYLYYINASDNTDIDTAFEQLEYYLLNAIINVQTELQTVAADEATYNAAIDEYSAIYSGTSDIAILNQDVHAILNFLEAKTNEEYPNIGQINYEISLLDPNAISPSTVAYYLKPPLDHFKENVIRLNPAFVEGDSFTTFTTLAHEGIPGHMYQRNYAHGLGDEMIRATYGFIGYTEGCAMYAELVAIDWLDCDYPVVQELLKLDLILNYLISGVAYIGMHYYGWDLEAMIDYFEEVGLAEMLNVGTLFNRTKNMLDLLVPYSAGMTNFANLYTDYADLGTDVINEAVLELGEAPYMLVRSHLESKR